MITNQTHDQPYPSGSMTLAMAQARIAELRDAAEHARLVRTARGPHRAPSWPASVTAALRDNLAYVLRGSRATSHRQPCPTC